MAAIAELLSSPHQTEPNEILTDDRIQALLQEAETRLQQSATSTDESDQQVAASDAGPGEFAGSRYVHLPYPCFRLQKLFTNLSDACRIPRLNSDKTVKPYVREVNGVASLDKSRAVPEDMKEKSETIRTVEKIEPKNKVGVFLFCQRYCSFPPQVLDVMKKISSKPSCS